MLYTKIDFKIAKVRSVKILKHQSFDCNRFDWIFYYSFQKCLYKLI